MKKYIKIALAAAIAGLSAASQANLLIDDFSQSQLPLSDTVTGGGGYSSSVCGAGILGGCRDMFIEKLSGAGSALTEGAQISASSGALKFASGDDAIGRGIVRWDGAGAAYGEPGTPTAPNFSAGIADTLGGFNTARGYGLNGGIGLDLTTFGNAFLLSVNSADHGFLFTINLYTSATQYSSLTLVSGANGDDHTIPFSLFTAPICPGAYPGFGACSLIGGGVDLTKVTAMEAVINDQVAGILGAGVYPGSVALDMSIDMVNVVPEPGSLALVGVALLGVAAVRRRKTAD